MSRPTIAIDVDDVLVDFNKVILKRVNEKYGKNRKLEDVTWNFDNLPSHEREYAHSMFASPFVHADLWLTDGALEFVEKCAKDMEVIFVTSVFTAAIYWRSILLEQNFGHLDYSVVYTKRKDLVHTDFMIDDSSDHVNNSSARYSMLLHKPWNKDDKGGIIVYSLEEAWEFIESKLNI